MPAKLILTETPRRIIKLLGRVSKVFGDRTHLRLLELAIAHMSEEEFDEFYDKARTITRYCSQAVKRSTKNNNVHYANAKDMYFRNSIDQIYNPVEDEDYDEDWDQ